MKFSAIELVMRYLSHSTDDVAIQIFSFLNQILYLGSEDAQEKMRHLVLGRDTNFFLIINKLLSSLLLSLAPQRVGFYSFYSGLFMILYLCQKNGEAALHNANDVSMATHPTEDDQAETNLDKFEVVSQDYPHRVYHCAGVTCYTAI